MNSSAFMDKQIMGLSGSPASGGGGGELFNLMNNPGERGGSGGVLKREEILPSYDFQPIRPVPSPPNTSGGDAGRISRFSSGPPFGEATLGPDSKFASNSGASIDDVDCTVKKYADILLHALEGMSSRLSQLESRTCILENSVDDLKVSIGNNYGSTDGKLRHLENILSEVQASIQVLRDKQEIAEAHLELAKLQLSSKKDHSQSESSPPPSELPQIHQYQPLPQAHPPPLPPPPPPHQPMQQAPQLPPIVPSHPPNAPPPPPPPSSFPQQNLPPAPYIPQSPLQPHMPSIPSLPQELSYSNPVLQYSAPPGQFNEPTHPQQQYQMPQPQYQPSPQATNYSLSIQPEDPNSYLPPSHPYPQKMRQPSPPTQTPSGPHQYYGANQAGNMPVPSSYGGAGFSEQYLYGSSPSHYNPKPSPFPSTLPTSAGTGNYQHLPTAKILPQPAGSSSTGGSPTGNRVPIDDVVDKVSTMGFSREQVRATVRKLTENGQSVDLNVVLDKLMNGGDLQQPAKGWFGR